MSTVVITGANRGIGLEFCRQYLAKGHSVIAMCRKASEELKQLDVNLIEEIDVASSDLEKNLKSSLGTTKVDILINNAGIFLNETLDNMDFSTITKQFEINTLGPLRVTMALLENLNENSKVGIVSSRMGSMEDNSSGNYYGYRMSKAGVNAIGKSLAMDLKSRTISVALLHPGYVKTEMTGFNGDITPDIAASGLIQRMDELTIEKTGGFWHTNGEELPW